MLNRYLKKNYKINENDYLDENEYNKILIQFDELDYNIKESLLKMINFNTKYNRQIYLELCNLIGYQIDKVTKTFEILNDNDVIMILS